MKIAEVTAFLNRLAPPQLQEPYDNSGFLVGDRQLDCSGVLVTLDVTEEVLDEAIQKGCNLIVAHHPIIFKGLKRLTGDGLVQRVVMKAIRENLSVYAIHTNLDNVLHGVNGMLAGLIGLTNTRVLDEKRDGLKKLVTFVPVDHAEKVRSALFASGGGFISNYDECSFNLEGTGTFRALEDANPFVGNKGERHYEKEVRMEMIFPAFAEIGLVNALRESHPYEEVAFYITTLDNTVSTIGSGIVGDLEEEMDEMELLYMVKDLLNAEVIRHTDFLGRKVSRVALCGGSGFFLLPSAKAAGAQVYITADIKYHEFFEADGEILLADAGHYETEQYTVELG
ncbi:MAG TPA: Nif3-like dinuclear metal center hexameric protein [Ginsengibacter sp.]|nr:Nif3-like dinuclear metal center hexameric protein [Ginsengibacter sp.]HRP16881.1 Nif3-like dinuclear metal center hexameric protein [Ginsengibacter sp.]